VPIDGLAEPADAHELIGPGPARTRLEAAAARGLTPFVGRSAELEQLRAAAARARRGHGQVVAVIGEPGIGKSRLLREFAEAAEAEGWRRLEWRALAHGRHTPYRPVAELLRAYFAIGDADDPRLAAARVRERLGALDRALEAAAPPLLALLGLPADDPGWEALDPAGRRQRTRDAVRGLVLRESRAQPVLLVAEDLQWADAETQALVDALVDSLPGAPLLLLASYRPEYRHGWASRSGYDQVRLSALPADGALALLDALLGPDPGLGAVKRLLVARTDGNPFFLEECARSLAETGVLAGGRGAYRLAGDLPAVVVPPTVQALLAARIDRLAPADKRLLETAAVIGKEVPLPLLEAVLDQPPGAVRDAVARLTAAELVYERGLFPEPELSFSHMLTHDVAYAGLAADDRRDLHARILDAMERLYPERLGAHVERLAEHAVKGERWDRAVVYLLDAANRCLLRSAHREALPLADEALAALERLPRGGEAAQQAVDAQLMRRNALYMLGESASALEAARRAEVLAARLGDRRRLAQIWAYLSQHLRHRGEHAAAIRSGQRALGAAEAPADDTIRLTAGLVLGQAYQAVGDFPRAIEALVTTVPGSLEGRLRRIVWIDARAFLAWTLAETGAFEDARSAADEALHLAEEVGHAYARAVAHMGAGVMYLLWGRPAEAIAVLERGVAIVRGGDVVHPLAWAAAFLGSAHVLAGRPDEALPLLEEAVALAEARGILAHQGWRLGALAEARFRAGDAARALPAAEAALALTQRLKERAAEAWVLHLLGEIAASRPAERAAAAAHYRHALALGDALGMRPLVARCHLDLGLLLGPDGGGPVHLATALEMLRAMDVRHWLERAAAALGAEAAAVTQ
jgi:tetratricopeptide (TPR) repeat protein